jgi:phosphatidylserine/phosphatidylglycerophosphate/cardiolipin synthase-like enzyme
MKILLRGLVLLFFISHSSLVYAETKVYFSPNGGCQEAVIAELNKARKSIDIAMFALTSREIARALVEAKEQHLKIRICLNNAQMVDPYSKCKFLVSKGLNVKFHLGPGLMHNKFAVIDNTVVITGSYNWTATAEKKNSENLLIIKDKTLAREYTKQFKVLWAQSGQGQIKVSQPEELN